LSEADRLGLDLAGVTSNLVEDGIGKFSDAADALLAALAKTRERLAGGSRDAPAAAED